MANGRLSRFARTFSADLRPLRQSVAFRRFWIAEGIGLTGTQVVLTTALLEIYADTHSAFAVGLTGAATFVPLLLFGIVGGAVADAFDRRVVVLCTSAGMALIPALLALQAILGAPVWVLFVLMAMQAALSAIDAPARQTFAARLLPADQLPAVGALEGVSATVAMTGGPLLAGVLVAAAGHEAAYAAVVVSYLAIFGATWLLPVMRPEGGGTQAGLRSIVDGLRFLRGRPVLAMTFLVDINAMLFGMPRVLFAVLAVEQFHGGPRTTGLLYAAMAIGGTLVAVTGGWLSRVRRQGLVVAVSVAVWGLAIALAGLAGTLPLALLLLAVAGGADTVSAVLRTTILRVAVPDAVRGRMAGLFMVTVAAGPSLGDLESGLVAGFTSAQFSVVAGGVACVLGLGLLLMVMPAFLRYRGDEAAGTGADASAEPAAADEPTAVGPGEPVESREPVEPGEPAAAGAVPTGR
ncbi:arabinose efflux permease family protein [Frankia sp. EI5c]|uniref:MFS transporter n=1 Tax=Frankia sp. EI5c TaxID=683316 RepID=UPI0007C3F1A5|nr:MFS transporter [Frankia sp. EI5c]OAA18973.1 arabinose efflux permease family protein [Frankia sp. EI5c]